MGALWQWWQDSADEWLDVACRLVAMNSKMDQLESRTLVLLADLWHRRNHGPNTVQFGAAKGSITRILISGWTAAEFMGTPTHMLQVTGTELDVKRAAAKMALDTQTTITITAVVGYSRPGES